MPYDPRKAAEKQIRRASQATEDYTTGVMGVKDAPGKKAAAKKSKYLTGVQSNVEKWAKNVGDTSLDYWQGKCTGKGAERYAPGVEDAKADIEAFHEEFSQHVAKVERELEKMPDDTRAARKAKMNANFDKMAEFKRSRKRR